MIIRRTPDIAKKGQKVKKVTGSFGSFAFCRSWSTTGSNAHITVNIPGTHLILYSDLKIFSFLIYAIISFLASGRLLSTFRYFGLLMCLWQNGRKLLLNRSLYALTSDVFPEFITSSRWFDRSMIFCVPFSFLSDFMERSRQKEYGVPSSNPFSFLNVAFAEYSAKIGPCKGIRIN